MTRSDGPLLDMSDQTVKKLIKTAQKRGYVTYDELNEVLSEDFSSEQIEDVMSMLSEKGINVIDAEDVEENEEEGHYRIHLPLLLSFLLKARKAVNLQIVQMILCACICVRWGL